MGLSILLSDAELGYLPGIPWLCDKLSIIFNILLDCICQRMPCTNSRLILGKVLAKRIPSMWSLWGKQARGSREELSSRGLSRVTAAGWRKLTNWSLHQEPMLWLLRFQQRQWRQSVLAALLEVFTWRKALQCSLHKENWEKAYNLTWKHVLFSQQIDTTSYLEPGHFFSLWHWKFTQWFTPYPSE